MKQPQRDDDGDIAAKQWNRLLIQQQKNQMKTQKPKLMSCLAVGCKEFAFAGFFCPAHEHLDKLQDQLCLAVGCKNERFAGYFCLVHSAKMEAALSNTSRSGSEGGRAPREAVAPPAVAAATVSTARQSYRMRKFNTFSTPLAMTDQFALE